MQGAKKANLTACLNSIVACTSLKVILTTLPPPPQKKKNFDKHYIDYCSSLTKILPQNIFTFPLGKLRTEFTSPIAKSTCPGLSDTTFFSPYYGNMSMLDLTTQHFNRIFCVVIKLLFCSLHNSRKIQCSLTVKQT